MRCGGGFDLLFVVDVVEVFKVEVDEEQVEVEMEVEQALELLLDLEASLC